MSRRIAIYIVCLLAAVLISGPILIAPWLLEAGGIFSKWGRVVYGASHGLCHQDPDRSYHWRGIQLAVCHRCAGIYAGAMVGIIVYPFTRYFRKGIFPSTLTLLIFATPVLIDLFLGTTGIWKGYPYIRTATGFLVAFIAVFYVVPGVDDLMTMLFPKRKDLSK